MREDYTFEVIEHTLIELADGTRLAARIWLPQSSSDELFPAVLEYLPYRKRDGTAARDESNYPWFARAGIAGVRVDISGNGDSDGDFDDEYSPRELEQGVEVINWIARQVWSNGNVGMMGISWGGFNGLQIAVMHPEPLKAVISIGTTVDRYNDDIHFKNGCHLDSDFYWSNMMLTYASRSPDPELRNDWLEVWKHRLATQPFPLQTWLSHQTRDAYWQHGSICENYSDYNVPTLIIGGWADHYSNAPPELARHASGVVKAVNGPWIHKYPHFAWPKPRMDFHKEAIAWWNHWLRPDAGKADETVRDTVEDLPAYRAFMATAVKPGKERLSEEGSWVACQQWPLDDSADNTATFFLAPQAGLEATAPEVSPLSICSPQDCGISCGERFSLAPDADLAGDQRIDDGGSLVFRTAVLDEAVDVLGRPVLHAVVAIDQPLGNLCARLIDVHPDGAAFRVSYGVLNLAHRNSNENPEPMKPGKAVAIEIRLDECAYRFKPGHRLQLSISTAYWPAIQPPPAAVTATFSLGADTYLVLPGSEGSEPYQMPEPARDDLFPSYPQHTPSIMQRSVEKDLQQGITHYRVYSDTGEEEIPEHGLRGQHIRDECWSICPDDPLTASATGEHTWISSRGNWQTRIVVKSNMHCDALRYYVKASVHAYLGEELISEREWLDEIPREHT